MLIPDNLFYTKTHEWVKLEDGIATVGITDFAQGELGDIIYFELPDEGMEVTQYDPFGTIEAVKTVADLLAPFSGKIVEVNSNLEDSPESVNEDPFGSGWIVKIEILDEKEKEQLNSADEYEKLTT
ncbi:MAG TPA: glycine cleavage system protein GcvH [Candidatus Marinimicrobia bacterium]|jgi:glycine cleavage system H protein|nr:MAG: glycine cleavage system protein H [Candidatus Neomarinimicrobiota bacterium]HIA28703.1 glycine cleavage system protein GcvH [Candidatus Neomarinimicrobiota bacterium]HIA85679.1 glycine cleavage system protein GcvH [Candidatus Neomarinimicrobiota bacterium]HIB58002.1 glycine cleavage system protein GcvH [Candidatus Neomarinimicrobiota bacterium]HIC51043.1 glycine cleavage system protein GcvH [Candidatus Neomarinimicrobiota bacterium]